MCLQFMKRYVQINAANFLRLLPSYNVYDTSKVVKSCKFFKLNKIFLKMHDVDILYIWKNMKNYGFPI